MPMPVSLTSNSNVAHLPSLDTSLTYVSIVPFGLLYLMEFVNRFTRIRLSCNASPIKCV